MGALISENAASVSLHLMCDDQTVRRYMRQNVVDPVISLHVNSFPPATDLSSLPRDADIIVFVISEDSFSPTLTLLSALCRDSQSPSPALVVIDPAATAERAVLMMKGGADDYIPHRRSAGLAALQDRVEEACLNILTTLRDRAAAPRRVVTGAVQERARLSALRRRIHKLVRTARYLATRTSLDELCEGLLETLGEATGATGGSLYLKQGDCLKRVHCLDPGHAPATLSLPLREGSIFASAFETGKPIMLEGDEQVSSCQLSGWGGYQSENLLVYPLMEKGGAPIGLLSLHGKEQADFTEEDRGLVLMLVSFTHETIRALMAHEKSNRTLESLNRTFENMEQGILLLDTAGKVVHFNHRFAEHFGLPGDAVKVGQTLEGLYQMVQERGDVWEDMPETHHRSVAADGFVRQHTCADGKILGLVGNPADDGGLVLTCTDITEQKKVERDLLLAKEEAEAASRSKTSFLANISHELRTPLNAIIGFAELMDKEVFGPLNNKRYAEYVDYIHDSGSHLLGVINNLLDLSKVEAGKLDLRESEVHLPSLIESSVAFVSSQAQKQGLDVRTHTELETETLTGDEDVLRQILLNLLSNAVKFTGAGGAVLVRVRQQGDDHVAITVKDNGIGMSPEDIEVALKPFGQVRSDLAQGQKGTGLGLPLVASLVEAHGGRFEIDSSPGKGTRCTILLPYKKD
ncbi:ATP-binding protein [Sneathiella chinensis]|nr:ATP-binding protein [Sneathiella chinensis]